jgi:hypothetical protein
MNEGLKSGLDETASIEDVISLLALECRMLYPFSPDANDEVSKFALSIRKILELTLKVIVKKTNPGMEVMTANLFSLKIIVKHIPQFKFEFNPLLDKYQKKGNDEAHGYPYFDLDRKHARLELYLYLKWFFEEFLGDALPQVMTMWHNQVLFPKPKDKSTSSQLEDNEKAVLDKKKLAEQYAALSREEALVVFDQLVAERKALEAKRIEGLIGDWDEWHRHSTIKYLEHLRQEALSGKEKWFEDETEEGKKRHLHALTELIKRRKAKSNEITNKNITKR